MENVGNRRYAAQQLNINMPTVIGVGIAAHFCQTYFLL